MRTNLTSLAILCLFVMLSVQCKGPSFLTLEDVLPSARFNGFDVQVLQDANGFSGLQMEVDFYFRNPYKQLALPLPEHKMNLVIGEKDVTLIGPKQSIAEIPAQSEEILTYQFKLTKSMLSQFMGKEQAVGFSSTLKFDLTDFTDQLPSYNIKVTDQFNLDSTKIGPIAKKLLEDRVTEHELELKYLTKVKIPNVPQIQASANPVKITLVGTGLPIPLDDIKNQLTPFGDLIITGELEGLTNPFVEFLTGIEGAFFTWLQAGVATGLTTQSEYNAAQTSWANLKSMLNDPNDIAVMDHFIDNFLSKVNSNASTMWDGFQNQWENFKNLELPNEIPSLETEGMRIAVPFKFVNTNEFPIQTPIFMASAVGYNQKPFSFYILPENLLNQQNPNIFGPGIDIPASGDKTLYLTFELNWSAAGQGFFPFLNGADLNPNIQGAFNYDFGYGPILLKFDLNTGINYQMED